MERKESMIEDGSTVTIHYTLTVDDQEMESSFGGKPLTYQQGQGQLIPGLESKLEGLDTGDTKEVTVPPADGYGDPDPENVIPVPKSSFSDPENIAIGSYVEGRTGQGQPFRAKVTEERDQEFVLDLNHPLAGKTLHFKVEVVEVA
jgi:FKBP-type peptidyl-prolyl cis-trans isomerase SlyD